jgi:AbrB family looped-hinge helix DNA binding protein
MKSAIDTAGRLVIPKEIRRQAGIQPGMALDVRWRDGRIEIEPEPLKVRLVREGRFLVAVPETDTDKLTYDAVEETRQSLARERGLPG